jgi:hypothetical protein
MMNDRPKDDEIGALWKSDRDGDIAFTGNVKIDGKPMSVVVFVNKYKEPGSKQPDYRIVKSRHQKAQTVGDPPF